MPIPRIASHTDFYEAFSRAFSAGSIALHHQISYSKDEKKYRNFSTSKGPAAGYVKLTLNEIISLIKEKLASIQDTTLLRNALDHLAKQKNCRHYESNSLLGKLIGKIKQFISRMHSYFYGFGFQTSAERALKICHTLEMEEQPSPEGITLLSKVLRSKPEPAQIESMCRAINDMSYEISTKIKSMDNICISSIGVMQVLALLIEGYSPEDQKKLLEITKLTGLNVSDLHMVMRALRQKLNFQKDDCKLSSVNAIIHKKNVSESFRTFISKVYEAEAFQVEDKDILSKVNEWTKEQSKGLISQLLDKVPEDVLCVLLNVIYFEGQWEKPFSKNETKQGPFRTLSGQVEVPYMHLESIFESAEIEAPGGISMVALPYKSPNPDVTLHHVFFQHKEFGSNLNELLTNDIVLDLFNNKRFSEIKVQIPKMELDSKNSVFKLFKEAGISVDLPKINKDAYLSDISQTVKIKIDEKGTVAVAVTGAVGCMPVSIPLPPKEFKFDKPGVSMIIATLPGNNPVILFRNDILNPLGK